MTKNSLKLKRNITRIIPFGIIWLVTSWFFLLNEMIITGYQNLSPDSAITLTLPVFIFASIAVTFVGLIIGTIELIVLERKFRHFSFKKKVLIKFIIYLSVMLVIISIVFPIATSIEQSANIFSSQVIDKTINFFSSSTFLSTMLQLSFHLILSLLYAAVSEHLGHQVLLNFFTGKYHKPTKETRIFMFLDMKDSTTIAERLGNKKYFELLQEYYEMMSDAIINTRGEVYQYIGDEVVITWDAAKGLEKNNCISCFAQIKVALSKKLPYFRENYEVPDFKAGIHIGEVSTGEIGALKKEIVFTGDILNTTARIQGLCKSHETDLIISDVLLKELKEDKSFTTKDIGELTLKGKSELVKLHSVSIAQQA